MIKTTTSTNATEMMVVVKRCDGGIDGDADNFYFVEAEYVSSDVCVSGTDLPNQKPLFPQSHL